MPQNSGSHLLLIILLIILILLLLLIIIIFLLLLLLLIFLILLLLFFFSSSSSSSSSSSYSFSSSTYSSSFYSFSSSSSTSSSSSSQCYFIFRQTLSGKSLAANGSDDIPMQNFNDIYLFHVSMFSGRFFYSYYIRNNIILLHNSTIMYVANKYYNIYIYINLEQK